MAATRHQRAGRLARQRRADNVQSAPSSAPELSQFEATVYWYHDRVLESIDVGQAAELAEDDLLATVADIVRGIESSRDAPAVGSDYRHLAQRLVDEMRGLGPLGPLVRDPLVSDILVNGTDSVYVERDGRLSQTTVKFRDTDHLMHIAQRVAQNVGRRIDQLNPMCDARLADGSRVNIIGPPLAVDGAAMSIRRFRKGGFTLKNLQQGGAMHPRMLSLLEAAAGARLNIVVSGGTGSGKTTVLNALSGNIDPAERVVTLEDAAELDLRQPHVVRLETRVATSVNSNEITMRDLLKNALRMRPDRIIVGEVRGGEALEALQAMNTGHPGSMFTVHANSPQDTMGRLEYLVMMSAGEMPVSVIRRQIVEAVDIIVQTERFRDGRRRIVSITEVAGMEGDQPVLDDIWAYDVIKQRWECSGGRRGFEAQVEGFGLGALLAKGLGRGADEVGFN